MRTTRWWLLVPFLVVLLGTPGTARAEVDPVGSWPVREGTHPPAVVTPFDPPDTSWGAGHRGVDLAGVPGQVVRSALTGSVSFVGMVAGRPVVVVDHGETRTTYEPVDAAVARGDRLRAGEVLGRLAVAGSHCFPRSCLHWGWLRGDTYLDPLRLVGGGPVRLLPLAGLSGATAPLALTRPVPSPYAEWRPWGQLHQRSPGR